MGGLNVSGRGLTVEGEGTQSGQVSGFSPDDISGLEWWLDADALSGLNDGETVETFTDQSGEGNDFERQNGDPTYRTGVLNGKSVVRFDGNDWFSLPTGYANSWPYTFIAVYSETGDNGNTMLIDEDTTNDRVLVFHRSGNIEFHYNDDNLQFSRGQPFSHFIYTVRVSSNQDGEAFENGALRDERVSADAREWDDTPFLGADPSDSSRAMDGDVAEVLVYNHDLSDSQRSDVESYLSDKWGISLA